MHWWESTVKRTHLHICMHIGSIGMFQYIQKYKNNLSQIYRKYMCLDIGPFGEVNGITVCASRTSGQKQHMPGRAHGG